MPAYATNDDVFTLGLSAQAFVVRPRSVGNPPDVDGTTGTIRLKAHGWTADDLVTIEVTSGGSLPTGVTAYETLHPLVVSFDLLRLSLTSGGTALTFASVGSGWALAVDPLRRIARHCVETAAEIDQHLTAHGISLVVDPLTGLYPQVIVGLNARMAARAAVNSLQIDNAAFKTAVDRLFAREEFDQEMLKRFVDGWPVKGATDSTDGLTDNGARAASSRDVVDWNLGYL